MKRKQDVFAAIADATRRDILQLLASNHEMALHELTVNFNMGRTAVSKHLSILEAADLVKSRKVGRETRYRLNASPLREVTDWLSHYEALWQDRLQALDTVLNQRAKSKKEDD